jgi:hypothetical protein
MVQYKNGFKRWKAVDPIGFKQWQKRKGQKHSLWLQKHWTETFSDERIRQKWSRAHRRWWRNLHPFERRNLCKKISMKTKHAMKALSPSARKKIAHSGIGGRRGTGKWGSPFPIADKRYGRDYGLRRHYGITFEDFQKMLRGQRGKCGICGKPMLHPHVDHNHITNKVRGLLCYACNSLVGRVEKYGIKKIVRWVDHIP